MNLRALLCLPLTLSPLPVAAGSLSAEHVTLIGPTLAAFYTIDEAGRSVRDTPVVEAIATPEATSTVVIVGLSSESASPPARSVVLRSTRAAKGRPNRFARYRCERSGFYFTQSGRCVLPANSKLRSMRRPGRNLPATGSRLAGGSRSDTVVARAR